MSAAIKTPFVQSLDQWGNKKVWDFIQLQGKALPATVVSLNGSIVTVQFPLITKPWTLPQVTVPVFGPEYIRYPLKPGDKGVVFPADAHIGGMTGLGGGTASLARPSSLGALVFFPVGNTNFPPLDQAILWLYASLDDCSVGIGPSGVEIDGTNGNLDVAGNLTMGNGATGSFTTGMGQTVQYQNGLIINVF